MSFLDKVKDKLGANKDKVEQGLDKVGDKAKERFSGHSDKIDQGITKAKEALNRNDPPGNPPTNPTTP